MKTKAFAKVNFILNVTGKRLDGYHELYMVNSKINLYDDIKIKKSKTDKFHMNKNLCSNKENIGYKAYLALKEKYKFKNCYNIRINKKIPSGAGLGGGSADAARILKDIINLEHIDIKEDELIDLAIRLGSDIPYCLYDDQCIVTGIGEKIQLLDNDKDYYIVLASPSVSFSTKKIYEEIDKIDYNANIEPKIENFNDVIINMNNDLERATILLYQDYQLEKIKNDMKNYGAINSQMTGSGSSIFGVFDVNDKREAKNCVKYMNKNYKNVKCKLCKTISY